MCFSGVSSSALIETGQRFSKLYCSNKRQNKATFNELQRYSSCNDQVASLTILNCNQIQKVPFFFL